MQTNLGSSINPVSVSYIYAVRYGYSDAVIHNDNQLRIFPRSGEGQFEPTAEIWSIPSGRGVDYNDRFGNRVRRLRVIEPHSTFVVASAGNVSLAGEAPSATDVPIADLRSLPESFEYTFISPLVDPDSLTGLANEIAGGDQFLVSVVNSITEWVFGNILYKRGATSVATTAKEVLSAGEGVCQDKTHLALGLLRALKVPCRYASGLLTGQRGETHSWVEFFHPVEGWLGADPTRGDSVPACSRLREVQCGQGLYGCVAGFGFFPFHRRRSGRSGHRRGPLRRPSVHLGRCSRSLGGSLCGTERSEHSESPDRKAGEALMSNTVDARTITTTETAGLLIHECTTWSGWGAGSRGHRP